MAHNSILPTSATPPSSSPHPSLSFSSHSQLLHNKWHHLVISGLTVSVIFPPIKSQATSSMTLAHVLVYTCSLLIVVAKFLYDSGQLLGLMSLASFSAPDRVCSCPISKDSFRYGSYSHLHTWSRPPRPRRHRNLGPHPLTITPVSMTSIYPPPFRRHTRYCL